MARYTGPKTRIARKFGEAIFGADKVLSKKNYPPGQHGNNRRRKTSEYGVMLAEKQKAKYTYGVLEKQFRNMFVYLVYKKYIIEFLCSHFIRPAPHPPNRIGTPHSLRSFPCSLFSPFAATGRAGSPSFLLFGRRPEIRRSASVTAQAVRPEDRPPASEKTT